MLALYSISPGRLAVLHRSPLNEARRASQETDLRLKCLSFGRNPPATLCRHLQDEDR
jgi:hypothetical protein